MRVFCVLVPGGGGPPARRPRCELPARPARSASAPRAVGLARLLGVRAVSCPLGPPARRPRRELRSACRLEARAASFARRVVSKPALRAARFPSAALRAARFPSAALRADRSPSVELVFSCLSACWCPGAAARPLAVRAASFARRVVSKPGQALPPPPGTRANTGAWLLALSRPGRVVRRGEPTTERVHRPATASSLGATRRGLCLPSQLRFPLAFGR